jgi:hypothetical protein
LAGSSGPPPSESESLDDGESRRSRGGGLGLGDGVQRSMTLSGVFSCLKWRQVGLG